MSPPLELTPKRAAYDALVAARKACDVCELSGLTNPARCKQGAFDSEHIGLEFGQATEQGDATLFWKVGDAGVILDARQGKSERFRVFMSSDAVTDRGRMK